MNIEIIVDIQLHKIQMMLQNVKLKNITPKKNMQVKIEQISYLFQMIL